MGCGGASAQELPLPLPPPEEAPGDVAEGVVGSTAATGARRGDRSCQLTSAACFRLSDPLQAT